MKKEFVMKKHIFIACLALAAATAAEAQTTFTEGDFTYRVLQGSQLAVAGCSLDGVIANVPETVSHEGTAYTVTAVADSAFIGKNLPAIGLPKTITTIGSRAFLNCSSTTYIQVPAGVTSIGEGAFSNCTSLGHLDLPVGLTQLTDGSFSSCSGLYTLGDNKLQGITAVGTQTFSGCQSLLELPLETPFTSIGDEAFYGCKRLREILLSGEATNIGASAFTNCSQLTSINLSQYRGPIGIRAFNGCGSLQGLTLPADNPYCRVSGGGKAIVGADEEVITVLPSLKELTINYPATGENGVMNESFDELQELEVPCTWTTSLSNLGGKNLRELAIRAPFVFPLNGSFAEDGLQLSVFDYMMEEYEAYFKRNYNITLHAIDLPTSKLYVQEVLPRYPEAQSHQEGNEAVVWTQDFNTLLEETLPQYFRNEGTADDLAAYRSHFINRYITEVDRFDVYNKWNGEVLRCIDGTVRLTDRFDVNDYFNWYAHNDTTFAGAYYLLDRGDITPMAVDASWQVPGNQVWLLEIPETSPIVFYALNLLPGVPYDIHLLLPPHHPLATEESPLKNMLSCQLTYNEGRVSSNGKMQLTRGSRMSLDVEYDGTTKDVLLIEDLEVQGDYGNQLYITSGAKSSQLKNGYTHAIPLIGIRVVPKADLEWLSTGVQEPDAKATVVERYDLSGRRIVRAANGVQLYRMSDGSVRKVLAR